MLLAPPSTEISFDPLVEEWFARRFGAPTAPQVGGWPHINEGRDVLISAPTGSGKTLAAFMVAIDRLLRDARNGLTDSTHVVYVSPLNALVNDVHANLQQRPPSGYPSQRQGLEPSREEKIGLEQRSSAPRRVEDE